MKKLLPILAVSSLAIFGSITVAQGYRNLPATMKALSSQQYTKHAKGIASDCSINTNTESAYPDTLVRSIGQNFNTVMINFNHKAIQLQRVNLADKDQISNPMILWQNPQQKVILALETNIDKDPQDKMNEVGTGLLTLITPKTKESYMVNFSCLN